MDIFILWLITVFSVLGVCFVIGWALAKWGFQHEDPNNPWALWYYPEDKE